MLTLVLSSLIAHRLLNKITEMEEAFDKPQPGRQKKGKKEGDNDAKYLSKGQKRKVQEYMAVRSMVFVLKTHSQ